MIYFDKTVCGFVQNVLDDLEAGRYDKPEPGKVWWKGSMSRWSDSGSMIWGLSELIGWFWPYIILERGLSKFNHVYVPLTRWERKLLSDAFYRERKKCKQMIKDFAREARN